MTSVEPGVLDANVLAYAINADAAQHVAARTLLEAARDPSTNKRYLTPFFFPVFMPRLYVQSDS